MCFASIKGLHRGEQDSFPDGIGAGKEHDAAGNVNMVIHRRDCAKAESYSV